MANMPRRETVQVVVDDAAIAADDLRVIIEPVWWLANIYDGPGLYEQSLKPFSQSQRFVFAIRWYVAEVCNGGHKQFYSNSTGIVWRDALAGFQAIDLPRGAQIVSLSAERMGGSPSLEREDRQEQLDALRPDFEDCDEALFALKKQIDIDAKMMDFIRARPQDFFFSGTITKVVLPTR